MKISEAFPSKYLKAADLNGTPVRVKIKYVALEDVGGQGNPEDTKPVISFTGTTGTGTTVSTAENSACFSAFQAKNPTYRHP